MTERSARGRATRRRRIGFLTHGTWDPVGLPLWQGALEGAREGGADLFCFVGSDLGAERFPFESQANAVYNLASGRSVDGLVVSASALGGFIGPEGMRKFYKRFDPLPIVTISLEERGRPAVLVDNYRGMYDLVSHCITVHGRRRLVFLPGPWESDEVKERHRAYADALTAHGLEAVSDLIASAGDWTWASGRRSIYEYLDARGADFDAVIAASDRMAIGAMEMLARRGIAVPERVLVTGFNNSLDTLFSEPPLTTVHQPLFEMSRRATRLLIDRLKGGRTPQRVLLPAVPMYRQSCGCGAPVENPARPRAASGSRSSYRRRLGRDIPTLLRRMKRALPTRSGIMKPDWAERLLDSFITELENGPGKAGLFTATWEELIGRLDLGGRMSDMLQDVVSAVEPGLLAAARGQEVERAAALLFRARTAVGEAIKLVEVRRTWVKSQRLHLSLEIINSLHAAADLESVTEILDKHLPRVDIPGCVLAFYENSGTPFETAKPALVRREGAPRLAGAALQSYPSLDLVPKAFLKGGDRESFVVMPLFFQERHFGFIVFLVGTSNGEIYENIRFALCSTLQRLHVQRLSEAARAARERAYDEVESQVKERTRQLEIEVAERRRAEDALLQEQYLTRALTENTPDFIYFKDNESRYIRLNEALAHHLGLVSPLLGVGKTDEDFFSAPFAAKTRHDERRVMATGVPAVGIEEMELWPDGHESWTSTTKLPLRDTAGRIVGTIGISRDITGRKRAEAEVRRLNEELEDRVKARTAELEEANRELEGFSYSVSHDLRAPLRAMDGFARILMQEYGKELPSGAARHLGTIVESARQMGKLIDGLLAFSRLNRQALTSQPVSTAVLVRESIESLRGDYAGRSVAFDVGELPDCEGDPILLRQVWVNLISNALKFTRRRETARIEIGSRKITGRRVFFVKDNGVGFDMRYADKLFGVFQRLHRAEEYEGTGVGLATIQRIIHRHGGRIWAEARPDQGATFYFII
ncbi:MAG: substrate-binding domain-containing protein [Spirochaetales bacterium]|nr:substrate-binding domain-containing protein [Spirochaetales bacterium]